METNMIPVGWKRAVVESKVVYMSPSGQLLQSPEEVKTYLSTDGTCKCGLECPIILDKVFDFNPSVVCKSRTAEEAANDNGLTNLCNHKRNVVAMATWLESVEFARVSDGAVPNRPGQGGTRLLPRFPGDMQFSSFPSGHMLPNSVHPGTVPHMNQMNPMHHIDSIPFDAHMQRNTIEAQQHQMRMLYEFHQQFGTNLKQRKQRSQSERNDFFAGNMPMHQQMQYPRQGMPGMAVSGFNNPAMACFPHQRFPVGSDFSHNRMIGPQAMIPGHPQGVMLPRNPFENPQHPALLNNPRLCMPGMYGDEAAMFLPGPTSPTFPRMRPPARRSKKQRTQSADQLSVPTTCSPIQHVLSESDTRSMSASNLLSVAAKAQLANRQQQEALSKMPHLASQLLQLSPEEMAKFLHIQQNQSFLQTNQHLLPVKPPEGVHSLEEKVCESKTNSNENEHSATTSCASASQELAESVESVKNASESQPDDQRVGDSSGKGCDDSNSRGDGSADHKSSDSQVSESVELQNLLQNGKRLCCTEGQLQESQSKSSIQCLESAVNSLEKQSQMESEVRTETSQQGDQKTDEKTEVADTAADQSEICHPEDQQNQSKTDSTVQAKPSDAEKERSQMNKEYYLAMIKNPTPSVQQSAASYHMMPGVPRLPVMQGQMVPPIPNMAEFIPVGQPPVPWGGLHNPALAVHEMEMDLAPGGSKKRKRKGKNQRAASFDGLPPQEGLFPQQMPQMMPFPAPQSSMTQMMMNPHPNPQFNNPMQANQFHGFGAGPPGVGFMRPPFADQHAMPGHNMHVPPIEQQNVHSLPVIVQSALEEAQMRNMLPQLQQQRQYIKSTGPKKVKDMLADLRSSSQGATTNPDSAGGDPPPNTQQNTEPSRMSAITSSSETAEALQPVIDTAQIVSSTKSLPQSNSSGQQPSLPLPGETSDVEERSNQGVNQCLGKAVSSPDRKVTALPDSQAHVTQEHSQETQIVLEHVSADEQPEESPSVASVLQETSADIVQISTTSVDSLQNQLPLQVGYVHGEIAQVSISESHKAADCSVSHGDTDIHQSSASVSLSSSEPTSFTGPASYEEEIATTLLSMTEQPMDSAACGDSEEMQTTVILLHDEALGTDVDNPNISESRSSSGITEEDTTLNVFNVSQVGDSQLSEEVVNPSSADEGQLTFQPGTEGFEKCPETEGDQEDNRTNDPSGICTTNILIEDNHDTGDLSAERVSDPELCSVPVLGDMDKEMVCEMTEVSNINLPSMCEQNSAQMLNIGESIVENQAGNENHVMESYPRAPIEQEEKAECTTSGEACTITRDQDESCGDQVLRDSPLGSASDSLTAPKSCTNSEPNVGAECTEIHDTKEMCEPICDDAPEESCAVEASSASSKTVSERTLVVCDESQTECNVNSNNSNQSEQVIALDVSKDGCGDCKDIFCSKESPVEAESQNNNGCDNKLKTSCVSGDKGAKEEPVNSDSMPQSHETVNLIENISPNQDNSTVFDESSKCDTSQTVDCEKQDCDPPVDSCDESCVGSAVPSKSSVPNLLREANITDVAQSTVDQEASEPKTMVSAKKITKSGDQKKDCKEESSRDGASRMALRDSSLNNIREVVPVSEMTKKPLDKCDGTLDKPSDNGILDEASCSPEHKDQTSYKRQFETGDLVWGQIRGYSSWPGKLVSETEVKGQKKKEEGKVWVMWFGDHSFTQVEPDKLKTLTEGLEAHHKARTRHRTRYRTLTSSLEAAIQEAMMELDKKAEANEKKRKGGARGRPRLKRQKMR
ncbi:uncharacterized protein [Diadema antillarum]|uniref:uncharacterized protein n=1 Tax=Diadema antillarum TaxID=105358 RepID=UPI003A84142E